MLEIDLSENDILEAQKRSESVGVMSGSRTNGKGNLIGFLGELVVARAYEVPISDTFQYDLLINDHRIDVKTKGCTSRPKPDYLCSVMEYQLKNKSDGYIFCRADISKRKVWVLGYISKEDLLRDGFFCEAGKQDGKFFFTESCWSIPISKLREFGGITYGI